MTRHRRRIAIRVCELIAVVASALAVVIFATSLGGGSKAPQARSASLGTKPRATPTTAPRQPAHARRRATKSPPLFKPNCGRKGITTHGGKEGTCVDDSGHRITVVNRASTLHLNEMDVKLAPIRVRAVVGHKPYRLAATGVFVVLELTIHNNLRRPALFRPDEVALSLGPDSFNHDSLAETTIPGSFTNQSGVIPAGRSRTGTVVFDVPELDAPYLKTDGNVVIVQFRDESYDMAFDTVGYFRTYR